MNSHYKLLGLLTKWKKELQIIFGLGVFFTLISFLKVHRVGDGNEYYAMFLTWFHSWRPFMTEAGWTAFDELYKSNKIVGMIPLDVLKNAFPTLVRGETADFLHFWFYSLLAAVNAKFFSFLGINLGAHKPFILLHWELMSLVCLIAHYFYGKKGLAAVLILTLSTPIFWYVNKVHTEFFTYTLTLGAIILFLKSRYIASALLLSFASTQNISFAAISVFVLLIDYVHRKNKNAYTLLEMLALLSTAAALAIHPLYSFFRYGVYDPIVMYGAASAGLNLKYFYVWFIDPDLGLFTNSPVATILAVISLILFVVKKEKPTLAFALFFFVYIFISVIAQSSTTNMNSGATPGLARYALWYLCFLYPIFLIAIDWSLENSQRKKAITLCICILSILNVSLCWPSRNENYGRPSLTSRFLQRYLPYIYNPPAEIFSERYGDVWENLPYDRLLSVIGPDCKKMLVYPGASHSVILGAGGCGYDTEQLSITIQNKLTELSLTHENSFYLHLTEQERATNLLKCPQMIDLSVQNNSKVAEMLLGGFSAAEPQGRWNDGRKAVMRCQLGEQDKSTKLRLKTYAFTPGNHTQRMLITLNDSTQSTEYLYNVNEREKTIEIDLSKYPLNQFVLKFNFPDAVTPKSFGIGNDQRKIAVGIKSIEFIK